MNEDEKLTRLKALSNALASQSLEGLEVDAVVIADLQAWARGELTIDEIVTRLNQRIEAGEFQSSGD